MYILLSTVLTFIVVTIISPPAGLTLLVLLAIGVLIALWSKKYDRE